MSLIDIEYLKMLISATAKKFDNVKTHNRVCLYTTFYDDIPTVDYITNLRAYGQWEDASDGDGIVCSKCGADFCTMINETKRFNYCPNCGAYMNKKKID